jgi:DNA-binding transcriptional MerR regulator
VIYFAVEPVADNSVEIPNRAAFKASEVCDIARIPPYVLRSWEKEFPRLGAAARPGGPRIYNRSDVEQILRIKQLVFVEGLTLAGARRKLEGDPPPEDDLVLPDAALVPDDVRVRVTQARRDLRSLLEMLSQPSASAPGNAAHGGGAAAADRADAGDSLPLLDGVPDSPPRVRKSKRSAKEGRDGAASKVE